MRYYLIMVNAKKKAELLRLVEDYRIKAQRNAVLIERHEAGLDNGPYATRTELRAGEAQFDAQCALATFIKNL